MFTVQQLTAIGGREWQMGDRHRVYFNNLVRWYGLEIDHYKSGNISYATLGGEHISNTKARALAIHLYQAKLWYDLADGKFHGQGLEDTRDFSNLFSSVVAAIREAAAREEA